jgi:hypothetical protein
MVEKRSNDAISIEIFDKGAVGLSDRARLNRQPRRLPLGKPVLQPAGLEAERPELRHRLE